MRRDAAAAGVRDSLPVEDEQIGQLVELLDRCQKQRRLAEAQQAGHIWESHAGPPADALDDFQFGVPIHDHARKTITPGLIEGTIGSGEGLDMVGAERA